MNDQIIDLVTISLVDDGDRTQLERLNKLLKPYRCTAEDIGGYSEWNQYDISGVNIEQATEVLTAIKEHFNMKG